MTKETWALPENSLCNRGGNFGGTVNVGASPEEQAGSGSAAAHALSMMPKNKITRLQVALMAGLTPELRGAAKRLPLERLVMPQGIRNPGDRARKRRHTPAQAARPLQKPICLSATRQGRENHSLRARSQSSAECRVKIRAHPRHQGRYAHRRARSHQRESTKSLAKRATTSSGTTANSHSASSGITPELSRTAKRFRLE